MFMAKAGLTCNGLQWLAAIANCIAALQWQLSCSKSIEAQKVCLDKFQHVMEQRWGGTAVNAHTGKRGGHPRSLKCTNKLSGKLSAIMTNSTSMSKAKKHIQVAHSSRSNLCS